MHSLGAQLLHDRVEERLLAMRPVQVTVGQAVALADERQRLRRVQVLVAGREVRTGVGVLDRVVEADLHAAEYAGQLVEPVQVDLGEVVDVHAGELLDRVHGGLAPGLVALERELVLADARAAAPSAAAARRTC